MLGPHKWKAVQILRISKNKTKKATNPHLKVIIVPVTRAARSKVNNLASSASSFFRR